MPGAELRFESEDGELCAGCGRVIEEGGNLENSSGWRWYSDGRGGLVSLCPTCPMPEAFSAN